MNDKSNLLILILFTLTVGAVGWLGTILIGQQDQQLRITQINRLQQSLDLFKNNIENTIHNYNQRFRLSQIIVLNNSMKRFNIILCYMESQCLMKTIQ